MRHELNSTELNGPQSPCLWMLNTERQKPEAIADSEYPEDGDEKAF
jgi:hypothetical protein